MLANVASLRESHSEEESSCVCMIRLNRGWCLYMFGCVFCRLYRRRICSFRRGRHRTVAATAATAAATAVSAAAAAAASATASVFASAVCLQCWLESVRVRCCLCLKYLTELHARNTETEWIGHHLLHHARSINMMCNDPFIERLGL